MSRRRSWLAVVGLVVMGGCADPVGIELPALLEFTLTPLVQPAEPVEPGVTERFGRMLAVEGPVSFTGCSYLIPQVHGSPDDVRLDLTLEPTGGLCTLVPQTYRFSARIGGVADGESIRARVRLLPADHVILDVVIPAVFSGAR